MAKKYGLNPFEIAEYWNQVADEMDTEPFTGFEAAEIEAVEQKYGITFPEYYKKYTMFCGKHNINSIQDQLNPPKDIDTTYEYLEEDIDEYAEELEGLSEQEIQELCEENDIYKLCRLPKEEWHTVTQEYVLVFCENQGVWNAGYLRSDLEKGVPNPPVYISTNDDFITFKKAAEDTESFLVQFLFTAIWCLEPNEIEDKDEAIEILEENGIDTSLVEKKGVNLCLDTDTNILYACYEINDVFMMLIVNEEYDEDEDE